MRILLTGLLIFLIWATFSSYIYIEKIWQEPVDPDLTSLEAVTEEAFMEESSDSIMAKALTIPSDFAVYFEFDKDEIIPNPQNDTGFEAFIDYLIFESDALVEITGHADWTGPEDYNYRLGLRRANSVLVHFQKLGINDKNLSLKSEGELNPVADNNSKEGRAKNRRAEITIKK
ncbi:MAG: OmpA family protein [Bacteroidales bacterium]|nr:OmpA family protein [Bacteroidales bacterium]MCF8390057.1 OmpA family protein [Bacteroidales bacterium]